MYIKSARYSRPINKPIREKDIAAFDIETYGDKNKFLCGSIVYLDKKYNRFTQDKLTIKYFEDREEMISFFMKTPRFRHTGHWTFAHNLYFDIISMLKNTKHIETIKPLELHGSFIKANWKINDNQTIRFYDTFSHLKGRLAKLGEILGIEKLEKPVFLGKKPKDKAEWKILKEYNIRDSVVCLRIADFLQKNYNKIGCNMKVTLPSTSMDLYKRKYQKESISQPPRWVLDKQYNAMRGGRTEVIRRGKIENCKIYDVRSMYPAQMLYKEFPHPNYCHYKKYSKTNWRMYNIENREGISKVEMTSPYIHIPYLPVRMNSKLLFPIGLIKGWYTHYEIRKAIELGYEIKTVKETFYYTRTFTPFRDFVTDMYGKRMDSGKNESMKLFYKILMNSLFGKFAQKIERGIQIRHINTFSKKELNYLMNNTNCKIDFQGCYVYYGKTLTEQFPSYINPILSTYITAYARDYLFSIKPKDTYYMDTDSFITKEDMTEECGVMLGELELQETIKTGILVRPKMYEINGKIKIKGCPRAQDIVSLIKSGIYKYTKMSKYRESIRRKLDFNEVLKVEKRLNLEDNKRVWSEKFNQDELQESEPIMLTIKDYE